MQGFDFYSFINFRNYLEALQLFLIETGKYLPVLCLLILAVKSWGNIVRTWKSHPGFRHRLLGYALLFSALTGFLGYFALMHSLSGLSLYYGKTAFESGNLPGACQLFFDSDQFWPNHEAKSRLGITLKLMGNLEAGDRYLEKARALRGGTPSYVEQYFEGLRLFSTNHPDQAIPLLEEASIAIPYRWQCVKLLALIHIDKGNFPVVQKLLNPFQQLEIQDADQALIIAAIKTHEGKTEEAKALLARFPQLATEPILRDRFKALQARLTK